MAYKETVVFQVSGNSTQASSTRTIMDTITLHAAGPLSIGLSDGKLLFSNGGLTTAALSNHSHNFATTTTNGASIIVATTNSNGATIAVPAFLTTAQPVGAYLTTARASNDAVGLNTALTANGVAWTVNSSGLSLNVPAFLTTAAQSNHSHNLATTTTNGSLIVVATTNSAGATFAVPPYLTTAQAPGAYLTTARASNDAIGLNTALTANGVSVTANSSGLSLNFPAFLTTAQPVGAYLTTARASNDGVGLNTAQTNVTWTVNSSGISINASGYAGIGTSATNASITLNSNGLAISVAAPGGGGAVNFSAGTTSQNLQSVIFGNSNGISFGLGTGGSSNSITASHNGLTTAAASDHSHGNPTLALTNLTGTTASASNGFTLSLSAAAGAGFTQSYFRNVPAFVNSQTMTVNQSTSHIVPIVIDDALSFDIVRMFFSGSVLAASTTAVTTGNTQFSCGYTKSHIFHIYSRGVGASSASLQYYTSTQIVENYSHNVSAAANSTQFSYSQRYTLMASTGNVGFTHDYSSSQASLNFNSASATGLTGIKQVDFQFGTTLAPGMWWLMYGQSSTSSSQYTSIGFRNIVTYNLLGVSMATTQGGTFGAATTNTISPMMGLGSFTTVGGATTSSLGLTNITSSASNNMMYFQLMRTTN